MTSAEVDDLQLMTTAEVARVLAVSQETVRRYIANGELQGIQLQRSWRVTRASLVAFLNERHGANGSTKVNAGGQRVKS